MIEFEEALKAITEAKLENSDEIIESIKARLQNVNKEAKTLRMRAKKAEEDLQKSKTENPFFDVLRENGFEIDTENEEIDTKTQFSEILKLLKTQNSDKTKKITEDPAYIKLQKQLDKVQKAFEQTEKEKLEVSLRAQKKEIQNSLLSSFAENIMNGETVLELLIDSPKNPFIIEDGKVGFKLSDGDIITGTEQIIEEYKKLYPKQVLNKMKSGTESQPTKTNFKVPKQFTNISEIKSMTAEQIAALPKEQYEQMMQVVKNQSVS